MKNILFLLFQLICISSFSQQNTTVKKKETIPTVKISNSNLSKGIFVMTKPACPRCAETLLYFKKNKIVYTELLYNNAEDRAKIWNLIKDDKSLPKNITFPILVINGKISYSHEDLTKFLKTIK